MKRIISIIAIIVFIAALLFFFRYFRGKGVQNVSFDNINPEDIPRQITEVLPNYRIRKSSGLQNK